MKHNKFYMTGTLFLAGLMAFFTACKEPSDNSNSLSVAPEMLAFESAQSEKPFTITCNSDWTISADAEWITPSQNAGSGNTSINIAVSENTTDEERSIELHIKSHDLLVNVPITQEARDTLNGFKFDKAPDNTGMRLISMENLASEMKNGWNIGNTLDAIGGETNWGNPKVNQRLIDSLKAAGFNMIRIPIAWSKFSDAENFIIEESWMTRVEEVVNYVLKNDMYAMINIHWDEGWMQPTYAHQREVNYRLDIMWKQIATHFRDYGDHLLFAGTNEVMVEGDYGTPTEEYYTVQNSFNQTFITAARKTGGKNVFRYLIVQGFNTNIDHTVNFVTIPDDVVQDRMLMEVHYYDPYNFALNEKSNISQWGKDATNPALVENWANESHVDEQFKKMKTNFIDKGIGVILGEYGAISRTEVEDHEQYRQYYLEYVTQAAANNSIVPVYWDNGDKASHGFALFDRTTGEHLYPDIIAAMTKAFK